MNISDHVIQINDPSASMLHTVAYDVDMDKFKSAVSYRQIIVDIANYLDSHLNMSYSDYNNIRGISAPQLGFPFKIIGYKQQNKNKFCINPVIVKKSKEFEVISTNCGSFNLKEQVKVRRYLFVDLKYFDLKGDAIIEKNIGRHQGSFVIQHEVDHLNGITILDRASENK